MTHSHSPEYILKREAAWREFESDAKDAGFKSDKKSFVAGYDMAYALAYAVAYEAMNAPAQVVLQSSQAVPGVADKIEEWATNGNEVDRGFPY